MEAYFDGAHHPRDALLPRAGYVAVLGSEVIGYIAGHGTRRFGCDGEVQYLFVASSYRRHCIATELLAFLASWFTAQGMAKVCVDVNDESPAARSFYLSRGAVSLNEHWCVWNDIGRVTRSRTPAQEDGSSPSRSPLTLSDD